MEINPWGILFAFGLTALIAICFCLICIAILQGFKIIRLNSLSAALIRSILPGITITILFWVVKLNSNNNVDIPDAEKISITIDSSKAILAIDSINFIQ